MRKALILALLLCLTVTVCMAEQAPVAADGFTFVPPDGLRALALDKEASEQGVVYAAQSEDGTLRMVALCSAVRRSSHTSTKALMDGLGDDGNVALNGSVMAGDTEFALSTQTVAEGDSSVLFRSAAAVRGGKQITLFFIDFSGDHGELPAQVAGSVQWTD